jgi:hypothetical protein
LFGGWFGSETIGMELAGLRVEVLLEGGEVDAEVLREGEEGEVIGAHAVVRLPATGFGCGI